MITNSQSRTNIQEIAAGIYRINTPTPIATAGGKAEFSINQYLIVDDEPMLFHTGQRQLFPVVQEAISAVMPLTQGGSGDVAVTESDILGPSEAFRKPMDYFAHAPQTRPILERLALQNPTTLACMHGSAWRGDGAALLRALAAALT